MVRILTIKENTSFEALRERVIDGRFRGAQAEQAMERLKRANPHLDFAKLRAGDILFTPEAQGFKAAATEQKAAVPFADFSTMVQGQLAEAEADLKQTLRARAAERRQVSAAFGREEVKRAVDADAELAQQLKENQRRMSSEEALDGTSEQGFAAMTKQVLGVLDQFNKVLGGQR